MALLNKIFTHVGKKKEMKKVKVNVLLDSYLFYFKCKNILAG